MRRLSFDTPFDPDFPVYTRANAGEILPHVLSPLTWSTVGPGFEEGFRTSFADDCGAVPRPGPDRPFQMVGRLGGRFHLNLSVIRTVGERLPGTSAAAVDAQYMGDAGATGLPEHEKHPDDRRWRLKAAPTMARTMAGMGRRVDRDAEAVAEYVDGVRALLDGDHDPADLVRRVRVGAALFGRLLGTHVTARALTSPVLEQATNALVRSGVEPEDALGYVAAIPDLESAKPSRALDDIARMVSSRETDELTALIRKGSLAGLRESSTDGADGVVAAIDDFVDRFGHRGVGEYDPTIPVWEHDPDAVVAMVGRLLTSSGSRAPVEAEDDDVPPPPAGHDAGRVARQVIGAARSAMHRAERTKDNAIRCTGAMRRLLFALRGTLDIDHDRFVLCTLDELEAVAHGGAYPADEELDRRAEDLAVARAHNVAEWSLGEVRWAPDDTDADPTGEVVLTGIGGSAGVVEGRARVLDDPFGEFDDGDILVAHMTDTAWTPLFLAAGAVITDVGGVLSHATIVARELGIPAVVNVKGATARLRAGQRIRVDGGAGTVTVLD